MYFKIMRNHLDFIHCKILRKTMAMTAIIFFVLSITKIILPNQGSEIKAMHSQSFTTKLPACWNYISQETDGFNRFTALGGILEHIGNDDQNITLAVIDNEWNGNARDLPYACQDTTINNLYISGMQGRRLEMHLQQLPKFSHLDALFILADSISDQGMVGITQVYSLQTIWIEGATISTREIRYLGAMWNLKSLTFNRCTIEDDAIEQLQIRLPDTNIRVVSWDPSGLRLQNGNPQPSVPELPDSSTNEREIEKPAIEG